MEDLELTGPLPTVEFWSGQRVLVTGHTGFKGAWLSLWLERLGAEVAGYSLAPDQHPDLFSLLSPFAGARSMLADVAERDRLTQLAGEFRPTLLLHMAAQPLVRRSFTEPGLTFATNVQGTVNVLDAGRGLPELTAVLVVTTDKVYRNTGESRPYREGDPLGGLDPYSASKTAAEMVAEAYRASFFAPNGIALATARAGNVIGGGDWSTDRLVPDIWRAIKAGRPVVLRYPDATRPWQHVLDPICGYLVYLERLADREAALPTALNFGPSLDAESISVSSLAEALQEQLGAPQGWLPADCNSAPEAAILAIDSTKAEDSLGWRARLSTGEAVAWTAAWYRAYAERKDIRQLCLAQIEAYEALR